MVIKLLKIKSSMKIDLTFELIALGIWTIELLLMINLIYLQITKWCKISLPTAPPR